MQLHTQRCVRPHPWDRTSPTSHPLSRATTASHGLCDATVRRKEAVEAEGEHTVDTSRRTKQHEPTHTPHQIATPQHRPRPSLSPLSKAFPSMHACQNSGRRGSNPRSSNQIWGNPIKVRQLILSLTATVQSTRAQNQDGAGGGADTDRHPCTTAFFVTIVCSDGGGHEANLVYTCIFAVWRLYRRNRGSSRFHLGPQCLGPQCF